MYLFRFELYVNIQNAIVYYKQNVFYKLKNITFFISLTGRIKGKEKTNPVFLF